MKNLTAVFLIASIATFRVSNADEPAQPQAVVVPEATQEATQEAKQEEKPAEQTTAASPDAAPLAPLSPAPVSTAVTEAAPAEQPASVAPVSDEKPAYTNVGKASHDSVAAAKSKQWQNILIAAGAVAIAITALILVHNNAGH